MTVRKPQIRRRETRCEKRRHTVIRALEADLGVVVGASMQPFGSREEATEQENTQNHYDGDDDDLDQAHY
jgi:hypothetical protein